MNVIERFCSEKVLFCQLLDKKEKNDSAVAGWEGGRLKTSFCFSDRWSVFKLAFRRLAMSVDLVVTPAGEYLINREDITTAERT